MARCNYIMFCIKCNMETKKNLFDTEKEYVFRCSICGHKATVKKSLVRL